MNDEKFSLFPVAAKIAAEVVEPLSTPVTMTSREIAELTGKRHDNVLRDIREMLEELRKEDLLRSEVTSFVVTYTDPSSGRTLHMYRLPRRELEILLTGYSTTLRAKALDRLHYLEEEVKRLHAAALTKDVKMMAMREMSSLRPAVESLNKAQGGKTFAQKAKAVYEMAESQRRACSWRLEPAEAEALNQLIIQGLFDLGVLKPDGGLKAQAFVTRYQDVLRLYALECGAVVGSQTSP